MDGILLALPGSIYDIPGITITLQPCYTNLMYNTLGKGGPPRKTVLIIVCTITPLVNNEIITRTG